MPSQAASTSVKSNHCITSLGALYRDESAPKMVQTTFST